MMTSATGEIGVGKTYHLSKEILTHYQHGFLCISNFRHVYSHIVCNQNTGLLIEIIKQLGAFKKQGWELCDLLPTFKHTGVYMAIDEAHLVFGSDQWRRYQSDPSFAFIIEFLSQCRKQDVDIWWAAQDPSKIDINWRRYTQDWIRYRPMFPWLRKRILVPHPTRPIMRREVRYSIPIVWEERHKLDHSNPQFNYSRSVVDGMEEWSKASTLKSRRMVLSGWLDPFPYKLYDSHEMIGLEQDTVNTDFALLKQVAYIPNTMSRERFPTIKRLLGIVPNDERVPIRTKFKNLEFPILIQKDSTASILKQPEEFCDDLSFFNSGHTRNLISRTARKLIKSKTPKPKPLLIPKKSHGKTRSN